MGNILGLDLGTNSIGWAIRDLDSDIGDQIAHYGVVIFKKGVGEGKSGEFSLAAERRTNRSKRRLYNAKRYRKWATLLALLKNGMCPISEEELRLWSIGNWHDGKNKGREYPSSPDFTAWLAMDFHRIGKSVDVSVKLKPAFHNPYALRSALLETKDENDTLRLYKIGRAFYHLVQRRGFKTSRKNGKSNYGDNELFKKFKELHPDKITWKPSQIYLYLQSKIDPNPELRKERIRNNAVIQRALNEDEFDAICDKQGIPDNVSAAIKKAIYFVRPLRSQKGLVGKCTLETSKTRIPISHPAFEEFRALAFINNIQWRETDTKNPYEPLPIAIKKQILEQLFFRRFEKGKKKGKVDDGGSLAFVDIINTFSEKGKWEFNFKNKPNISTCPLIAGLMNVFDEEWTEKFVTEDDQFGINWTGLSIAYDAVYNGQIVKHKKLNHEAIWHLLFDFLHTKDDEQGLSTFCQKVLGWDIEKTTSFLEIGISQGYGSLSHSAILKITPYLQKGFIYSEAVLYANLSKALGKATFETNNPSIILSIKNTIQNTDTVKEKLNIVNSLIQEYFAENNSNRAKGVDNQIKEMAFHEVENKLKAFFGEMSWSRKTEIQRNSYLEFVLDKYLAFLDGKQSREEKASAGINKNPEIDYFKLPRVDKAIEEVLKTRFGATEAGLKKLYHPSDIDIYPKAKNDRLGDPNPPSKAWKNPMAMRTMYELRKLINYLLEAGKINIETKIVVEMARELNDANKRWAIQTYQRDREEENKEFAKAIIGVAKEKYPELNENDADNINKVRLWWEQLENGDELYKTIKTLKEDIDKYRLWKEQGCQCLYTGKIIRITDLFDGTSFDFEHTLPISDSFDNSLANLTICDAVYNRTIKKNQIPTQLKNYNNGWGTYQAIKPRIQPWINKVEQLKQRIDRNKADTKKAIRAADNVRKNDLIQKRHLLEFDYDYWDKKLKTFTVDEVPNWWKNSQMVDTQIIAKYARAYLKSLFTKVDVQKGTITAEFRKIYGIMGDEKKDRSKHSHHAKDAAVLTLIPGSAKREEILKNYYWALENRQNYHVKAYSGFEIAHVLKIEESVLINHVRKDQTLSPTKKKMRERGMVVFKKDDNGKFLKDETGTKIPNWIEGRSIRGQLHDTTYYGAIKPVERNENGYARKENGKYLLKQKDGIDELWIVKKELIQDADIENMIDIPLQKHILTQIQNGIKISEVVDFNNNKIRHVRCRVRSLTASKAIFFKEHNFKSTHLHKQQYIARNTSGSNYLNILYEGINKKNELIRAYRIINLFEFSQTGITDINLLNSDNAYNTFTKTKGSNSIKLQLKKILKVGDRVVMWHKNKEELNLLPNQEILKRLYTIFKFNNQGSDYNYLQHHLEARPDKDLDDGDTVYNPDIYQPRLKLGAEKFNCLLENDDFIILTDGNILFRP